jgi:hypothetical protein
MRSSFALMFNQLQTSLVLYMVCLLTLVDKHKQECRYDDEGDDNVGKNQSGSEDALATIGAPGRRMAHPITTIRAELLRWLVSHFSPLVNPKSSSAQPSHTVST